MIFEFKKAFKEAEPFIYRVKGDLYYIGVGVCRKCSKEESDLYKKFFIKYEEIKVLPYPSKKNISQLIELYEQIANSPKCTNYDEYNSALMEMAFGLSESEIKDILSQKNIITDVYTYKRKM